MPAPSSLPYGPVVENRSLNVAQVDAATTALMAQAYASLIANYQRQIVSVLMRNQNLSGTLQSGSVRAARYANSVAHDYGTARANQHANPLIEKKVLIEIKKFREIAEEFEEFDQRTMPQFFRDVISGRNTNHADTMAYEREMDFFTVARNEGTNVTPPASADTPDKVFESLILNITGLKNEFFRGIDRSRIWVVMNDATYSAFRVAINRDIGNANIDSAAENIVRHNGVRVIPSSNMPDNIEMIAMMEGAVAMPELILPYRVSPAPFSRATVLDTSYAMTATPVMPDTIFWVGNP